MKKVSVIGAGTWGMSLALLLSDNGHDVTVWSALPEEIENLKSDIRLYASLNRDSIRDYHEMVLGDLE